jgi:hypothetical protein
MSFRFLPGHAVATSGILSYDCRFGSGEDRGALGFMADPLNLGGNLAVKLARKVKEPGGTTHYPVLIQNEGAPTFVAVIGGGLT